MTRPPIATELEWNDAPAVLIRGELPDDECWRIAAETLYLGEEDAATLWVEEARWWRWMPDPTGEYDVRLTHASPGRGAFRGRLVR